MTGSDAVLHSEAFVGLSASQIEEIVSDATQVRVKSGAVLYREADVATHFYVLSAGRIDLCFTNTRGQQVRLHALESGGVLGILALLGDSTSQLVTAKALTDSQLLCWTRNKIRSAAAKHPKLLENCLHLAVKYLSDALSMHVAMRQTAQQKLTRVLLALADQQGVVEPNGVRLDTTNEQLADMSGLTLSSANRLIAKWKKRGVLSTARSSLVLHSPEGLMVEPLTSSHARAHRGSGRTSSRARAQSNSGKS
jgi:CRP-like cAMP-binding protein